MMTWACNPLNQKISQKTGYVFYDSEAKMLHYKVIGDKSFCLASKSLISMRADSLFIISYDTVTNLDYNGFPEPEIICSDSSNSLSGVVYGLTLAGDLDLYQLYCFIRVYDKNFQTYVKENKILIPEVSDFYNFEQKHGEIIKLRPVEKRW